MIVLDDHFVGQLGFDQPGFADLGRVDSKYQSGSVASCRRAIVSSAVMSCITAWMPARIERKLVSRSRFMAAVRSVAIAPAPLPR